MNTLTRFQRLAPLFCLCLVSACGAAPDGTEPDLGESGDELAVGAVAVGGSAIAVDPGGGSTDPGGLTQTKLAGGSGWSQYSISGTLQDADTGADTAVTSEEVVVVRGLAGVSAAPLSSAVKSNLTLEMKSTSAQAAAGVTSADDMVYIVHTETANQIDVEPDGSTAYASGCNDYYKNVPLGQTGFSKDGHLDKTFSEGDFKGHLKVDANAHGEAEATLRVKVKRGSVFGFCVPYAVGFVHVKLEGEANADAHADIGGSFQKAWSWQTQLAKPGAGKIPFMIGPVPVVVGFNVPIDFGISANAAASATFKGAAWAKAGFVYTCTTSGCDGSRSFDWGFQEDQSPTFDLAASVRIKPWVQGALRAYLYSDSIAYGQVGVRPRLDFHLWAKAGNSCGDANHDGVNESVYGAAFDARFDLDLTARAYAFGKTYDKQWNLYDAHVGFWKSGGANTPWSPIWYQKDQSGTVVIDPPPPGTITMVGGIRPCWPYTDKVRYRVEWGDGKTDEFSLTPWTFAISHTYGWGGTYSVKITVLDDAKGRVLGKSATRQVSVTGLPAKPVFQWPTKVAFKL